MSTLPRAIALAASAHAAQMDRNGGVYLLHPVRVMLQQSDDDARIVAVLHDVVEDTTVTLQQLREEGFSEEVIAAVDSVTQRQGEEYFTFVRRAAGNRIGRLVKIADLWDNLDPSRLASFTERDAERFARYRKALEMLGVRAAFEGAPAVWLQGPVEGVPPLLQPVAHAILEAREDVRALTAWLPEGMLWRKPPGGASVGFHVVHAAGSLDRLFTYARGEMLDAPQLATLAGEKTLGASFGDGAAVLGYFSASVESALHQLRGTAEPSLTEKRDVGRGMLPSTVIGLLVHAGDHTYRHIGQAITTGKLLVAR